MGCQKWDRSDQSLVSGRALQPSRHIFLENRVRMIVDAFQEGVNVVHLGSMPNFFTLVGCSMRGIQVRNLPRIFPAPCATLCSWI